MIPNQLPLFILAAKAGSFSAAARLQGLSPAAVSKSIRQLETKLGLRLFHRTTHALSLTQDGQQLYERVAPLLTQLEEELALGSQLERVPSGRLKVNLPDSFGRRAILPLMPEFMRKYPCIELDLHFDDRVRDLVGEGFDVGIGRQVNDDGRLIARPLVSVDSVIVASKTYVSRQGIPQHPEELVNHCCIQHRSSTTGRRLRWSFLVNGHLQNLGPLRGPSMNTIEAVLDSVRLGIGIAVLDRCLVEEEIESGQLVPMLERFSPGPRMTWVYYSSNRHVSARNRLFIEYVIAEMNKRNKIEVDCL